MIKHQIWVECLGWQHALGSIWLIAEACRCTSGRVHHTNPHSGSAGLTPQAHLNTSWPGCLLFGYIVCALVCTVFVGFIVKLSVRGSEPDMSVSKISLHKRHRNVASIDLHIVKVTRGDWNVSPPHQSSTINHNEDFVTTAVKCSSADGVRRNLPMAIGGGGSPDKSRERQSLLMIRPLDENHQPPYLMAIALDEKIGLMRVGSPTGHLLTSQKDHTSLQGILTVTLQKSLQRISS